MASFSYVDLSTLKVFSRLVYGRLDCVPTSLLRVRGGPPKEIFRDPKESKCFVPACYYNALLPAMDI
jgi:hypothetical protein